MHVVLTVAAPEAWVEPGDLERDLASVVRRWSTAVRDPGRLHVVIVPRRESGRARAWRELGQVGFGTRSLAVDDLRPAAGPVPARPANRELHERLAARAAAWRSELNAGGFDVRGDLGDLEPEPDQGDADPASRLLGLSGALADAQREIERISRRNETLEYRIAELGAGPRRLFRSA